jgi:hypothetical protein
MGEGCDYAAFVIRHSKFVIPSSFPLQRRDNAKNNPSHHQHFNPRNLRATNYFTDLKHRY